MLDLLVAHDLIQRRAKDRFETSARAAGTVRGAAQTQRPRRDTLSALGRTVSLQGLPFGRSLTRIRRLLVRRRSTSRAAAGC